jgi:hypothetical protein
LIKKQGADGAAEVAAELAGLTMVIDNTVQTRPEDLSF